MGMKAGSAESDDLTVLRALSSMGTQTTTPEWPPRGAFPIYRGGHFI